MQTIRGKLTTWYAAALGLTVVAFGLLLLLLSPATPYQELDQRIQAEADLTAGVLRESYRARGSLVQLSRGTRRLELIPEVSSLLEVVPDYLVLMDSGGNALFASSDARNLPFTAFERLIAPAQNPPAPSERRLSTVQLSEGGDTVRYVVRPVAGAGPGFAAILAGASTRHAELRPPQLLGAFLLMAPVIVALSLLAGSWISRRALAPVGQIIAEVREITDGRSLHRRLPDPRVRDELGELVATLNEMMGRLERSFIALRRFTADASHELKTPLTVLRAGVERAVTTPGLRQDTLRALEETLQEINRMTELVDALLTLARADEGRAPLHLEPVDLRTLLDEVRETGEMLAEPAGVAMAVDTPDRPVEVQVDRSRIRQLVLNLLTNAVKYTPREGRVRVSLAERNGDVTISVQDTGIGIAPGDLPHIFDRFYRSDSARSRTGERPGAGLGLAICKWIAEAHGGSITVQSRPGRGTTFVVTLPKGR